MPDKYISTLIGFRRVDNKPLEDHVVFESLAAASTYATSDQTAYAGQTLSVKGADGKYQLYQLQPGDGSQLVLELVSSSTGGGGTVQVQADWSETDDSKLSYIRNKPQLPDTDDTVWVKNTKNNIQTEVVGDAPDQTYKTTIKAASVTVSAVDPADNTEKQMPVLTEIDQLYQAPTGETTVKTTVGDINNQSFQELFTQMFYPYSSPKFGSFTISGVTAQLEVGATMAANPRFAWTINNPGNVKAGSLSIQQVAPSAATVVENYDPFANSYTATADAITHNSVATHTWRIRAINTKDIAYTADFTVKWLSKYWYGIDKNDATENPDPATIGSTYTNSDGSAFDSSFIRTKTGAFITSNSRITFALTLTTGARRIYLAVPTNLKLSSVIPAGGSTHYEGAFVEGALSIDGATADAAQQYRVYLYQAAKALTPETWNVTIVQA